MSVTDTKLWHVHACERVCHTKTSTKLRVHYTYFRTFVCHCVHLTCASISVIMHMCILWKYMSVIRHLSMNRRVLYIMLVCNSTVRVCACVCMNTGVHVSVCVGSVSCTGALSHSCWLPTPLHLLYSPHLHYLSISILLLLAAPCPTVPGKNITCGWTCGDRIPICVQPIHTHTHYKISMTNNAEQILRKQQVNRVWEPWLSLDIDRPTNRDKYKDTKVDGYNKQFIVAKEPNMLDTSSTQWKGQVYCW